MNTMPMFKSVIFSLFALASMLAASAANAEEIALRASSEDQFSRVKTVVELEGSLRMEPADGNEKNVPLKVDAELFFDEQIGPKRQLRHYWVAKATLQVSGQDSESELRKDRNKIVIRHDDAGCATWFSPLGPLRRSELELHDFAGSTFTPELLLPSDEVAVGDEWIHDDRVAVQLLHIETPTAGELTSKLVSVTNDVANLEITGSIEGTSHGVDTQLQVQGKYQFDRKQQFIKWFALSVEETRKAGFAKPGYHTVTRVRSARQVIDSSEALAADRIRSMSDKPDEAILRLEHVGLTGQYSMFIDRGWHLLRELGETATLRLVDDNKLVATCKIDRLPTAPAESETSLDAFQSDVRSALGPAYGQMIESAETVNAHGLRVLRSMISGSVKDLPVLWIYYHVANQSGERLSVIFTLDETLRSEFEGQDEKLVDTIQFATEQHPQASRPNAVSR